MRGTDTGLLLHLGALPPHCAVILSLQVSKSSITVLDILMVCYWVVVHIPAIVIIEAHPDLSPTSMLRLKYSTVTDLSLEATHLSNSPYST